jgi:anti-sigma regulatory factor (Ser/Thr protein kinase)
MMGTSGIEPVSAGVTWREDVLLVTQAAKRFATMLGFPELLCEEMGLVATELATNLIRHASGGTIRFSRIAERDRQGIEIESVDHGPGISNVEQAITDGYSTAGGPGFGLGAINRLMDELDIYPGEAGGLHVICRRWLRPDTLKPFAGGLSFGAASRAYRMLPENGDAFLIKQWDHNALMGVIDGLGHGKFAQRASHTARRYIEQHFDQSLDNLFRGAGRACRATRGVVMALARFDLMRKTVTLASVGNIETRLVNSPEPFNPIVRRGIVGLNAPNPHPTEHHWGPDAMLIMHSDGLQSHWSWNQFRDISNEAPGTIARRMLLDLARTDDDATVVVARSAV